MKAPVTNENSETNENIGIFVRFAVLLLFPLQIKWLPELIAVPPQDSPITQAAILTTDGTHSPTSSSNAITTASIPY